MTKTVAKFAKPMSVWSSVVALKRDHLARLILFRYTSKTDSIALLTGLLKPFTTHLSYSLVAIVRDDKNH
jgi:hypothetical protein